MQELEQLVQKFWANETTPAENKRLLQLLEQHRVTVKDSMQENFQQRETGLEPGLHPDRALFILQKIHGRLGIAGPAPEQKTRTVAIRQLYRRIAVAASVCIIAASAFMLTVRHRNNGEIVKVTAPAPPRLIRVANGQDSAMSLHYPTDPLFSWKKIAACLIMNHLLINAGIFRSRGSRCSKWQKIKPNPSLFSPAA